MRLLSLCSGYGGLDVAAASYFAKHGHPTEVVAYAEVDTKAAEVFAHHHPDVPNLGDIKTTDWERIASEYTIDVITAGYPCQPFSSAGNRRGVDDPRHLWPHVYAALRTIRPDYVILENVAGHRSKGFDTVLGDLAEGGFDVRWSSVRASNVGAPHRRERLFIIARPVSDTPSLGLGAGSEF